MKNVTITIEEKRRYEDKITIQVPNAMTREELIGILDKLEGEYHSDTSKDVARALKEKHCFTIVEQSYSFPDDPYDQELEINGLDMEGE